MRLRDFNISSKLTLLIFCTVIGIVLVTVFNLYTLRQQLYDERKTVVRNQVQLVHQSLGHFFSMSKQGAVSFQQAKQLAIEELRRAKFGDNNYFWITDLNLNMVMHPHRPDLEGDNLSDFADIKGKHLFAEMNHVVQQAGEGFVSYWWEKPGSSDPEPKISYVKLYMPWNWVIGSGVYIGDIEANFERHLGITVAAVFVILTSVAIFYSIIATSISLPLAETTRNMRALANGNLDITLPHEIDRSEIGDLQRATQYFREKLLLKQKSDAALNKLTVAVLQNPTSIMITDKEGRIEFVNPKFEEISGYVASEVIGKNPSILKSGITNDDQYKQLWETISNGGTWRGEFHNRHKDGHLYWESVAISPIYAESGEITHYLAIKEDINDKKETEQALFRQANYDLLTGLPNRQLAKDRLSQAVKRARRNNLSVATIFIDLDNFKKINDTLGHTIGDQLLAEMANRLKYCIREEDTVARLGGDEFLIILPDLKNALTAETTSLKVIENASRPLLVDGKEVILTTSVGIAIFPENADCTEVLLKHADSAMYKAKEAGGNTFRFFVEDMSIEATRRLETETRLRHALGNQEFSLVYQPIIDIKNGEVIKAEALLRWDNPSLGMVPPDKFIPVAEESGLINPIGDWVLEQACRQMAAWNQQFERSMSISVNAAYPQFRNDDFAQKVLRIVSACGLPPELLEIEITERVIMHESEGIDKTMHQLRRQGIKLAIDDYGTGYSSITYLKRFPLTALKIDKLFVQGATERTEDAVFTSTIIKMAHNLDLCVTAEGVENRSQLTFLKDEGCERAQGYLFSRPLTPAQFEEYMEQKSVDYA